MAIDRRTALRLGIGAGGLALAGCSGLTGTQSEHAVEYYLSTTVYDQVPERLHTSDAPSQYEWVVIDFRVTRGGFNANLFFEHTHIEVSQQYDYDLRGLHITQPEDVWLESASDSYEMDAETVGTLYYPYDEALPQPIRWRKGDLEDQIGVTFTENQDL